MSHRLALPLPSSFSGGEEFATFVFGSSNTSHPELEAYIDQLGDFLHKTRLIQYHPENYFRFLSNDGEALSHLDGHAVTSNEVEYMRELCDSFRALTHSDKIDALHLLIRDGPPLTSAKCLQSFFAETKTLQMNRQRHPKNDAARVTLRFKNEEELLSPLNATEERLQERIMESVMGYGMGPKKQHEVAVMRETVSDLVRCCNAPKRVAVETVLNIGEGKGYVSRALALCDSLQVIGLDCNPAHKERAVERVEYLMEGRMRVNGEDLCGRDMLNLYYEPRGHMATVACRVGPQMDWAALLHGHVRTMDAKHHTIVEMTNSSAPRNGEEWSKGETQFEEDEVGRGEEDGNRSAMVSKVQCRLCGHIARRGAAAMIVRHTLRHLQSGDPVPFEGMPSRETVNAWNCELPVDSFAARLTEVFFTERVDYNSGCTKRQRLGSMELPNTETHVGMVTCTLQPIPRLSRGTRVEVWMPSLTENNVCAYIPNTLTIVGYDGAPNRHFIIRDDARRKEAFVLLQGNSSTPSTQGNEAYPLATEAFSQHVAIVRRILSPLPTRTPPVCVPDLCNTVMMGLHPCGDLGSNICRLFVESASQGLLLVSCCWHALTNDGFPLSNALRRRGWCTEKISLLLATQPLDMWATASSEGHRGSARMLFFRSALKVLWMKLRHRWLEVNNTFHTEEEEEEKEESGEARGRSRNDLCCAFVDVPHLEPSFLRRTAKLKDTVTLEELYVEVCREYFYAETAKQTPYTWHERVCAKCRAAQERFMASSESLSLATELGQLYYTTHFSSFLGLTVLRMWMCHLVETLLLLDRALYLSEALQEDMRCSRSAVSLVPLFDGAVSPRMYGILARRIS